MSEHLSIQVQKTISPSLKTFAGGILQRTCTCEHPTIGSHSEGEECRKEREETLQRSMASTAPVNEAPPIVYDALHSPSQALDVQTRALMEPHFRYDFSNVRVHTDAKAARSARAVDALAYTVGQDVVFGLGQYAPHTDNGQRLIAHELTHVIQQSQSVGLPHRTIEIDKSGSPEEVEATQNEHSIQQSTQAVGIMLQRHDDPNQYLSGTNAVFDSQGEARMAALAEATALGPGHTITHDPMPSRGLPHYHVVDPAGERVRGHFFYRTRRRRRSYKVDWSAVRRVVITLGLSLAMIAVIIAALADPEPVTKLALAGLSAAMIAIVLGRLGGEGTDDQNQA
jgi:hypothetical protein